jgi:hypothetical protein
MKRRSRKQDPAALFLGHLGTTISTASTYRWSEVAWEARNSWEMMSITMIKTTDRLKTFRKVNL